MLKTDVTSEAQLSARQRIMISRINRYGLSGISDAADTWLQEAINCGVNGTTGTADRADAQAWNELNLLQDDAADLLDDLLETHPEATSGDLQQYLPRIWDEYRKFWAAIKDQCAEFAEDQQITPPNQEKWRTRGNTVNPEQKVLDLLELLNQEIAIRMTMLLIPTCN